MEQCRLCHAPLKPVAYKTPAEGRRMEQCRLCYAPLKPVANGVSGQLMGAPVCSAPSGGCRIAAMSAVQDPSSSTERVLPLIRHPWSQELES
jgi:hypothetical protein